MSDALYYRIRLAKDAPYSAVKLWKGFPRDPVTGEMLFERPCIWRAILNGEDVSAYDVAIEFDPITDLPVVKGEAITEEEYLLIMKTNVWAATHAPDAPEATPNKRVDLNRIPPLF